MANKNQRKLRKAHTTLMQNKMKVEAGTKTQTAHCGKAADRPK